MRMESTQAGLSLTYCHKMIANAICGSRLSDNSGEDR